MLRHALVALLAPLLAHAAAQTLPAFSNFGTGCQGTGWNTGANVIVPASLAGVFGNSNNNIPLSWTPTRYQQVFLGSEVGAGAIVVGIGLRQDEQFSGYEGQQINLEVSFGGTTFDHTTLVTVTQVVLAAATRAGGDLALSLPIPNTASLDGASFFLQAFVYDPSINALGFVASDGGMATIGR